MTTKKKPTRAQAKKNYRKAKQDLIESVFGDLSDILFEDFIEAEIMFSGPSSPIEHNCKIVDWGINTHTDKIYIVVKSDHDRGVDDE